MFLKGAKDKYLSKVTPGSVARYSILPGILPRVNRFILSIQHIIYSFICILGITGLIDKNHPCLRVENIGRYSFTRMFILAWQELRFKRENIPQILMFTAVCLTMLLIWAAFIIFVIQVLFQVGIAHSQTFYFQTPIPGDIGAGMEYDRNEDWIYMFLERIFGDAGIMDFWILGVGAPANPWFTALLKGMLKAYTSALLGLCIFMILYIVVMTVSEAAKTGKPFGKSFDSLWAPIRMAIALFLLMPISGTYYNAAQLLVFQTTEWGNNLANNVWLRALHGMTADDAAETNPAKKKDNNSFIGVPNIEPGYRFVRDVFLIHLCMKGYNIIECQADSPQVVEVIPGVDDTYATYKVGIKSDNKHTYCGQVRIPLPYYVPPGAPGNDGGTANPYAFWPNRVVKGYEEAVLNMLSLEAPMSTTADGMVVAFNDDKDANFNDVVDPQIIKTWIDDYRKVAFGLNAEGKDYGAYEAEENAFNAWIMKALQKDAKHGWATAGAFYLRMTTAMSMASKVVSNPPVVDKLPVNLTRMFASPNDPELSNKDGRQMCQIQDKIADKSICKAKAPQRILYALLDKGNDWFTTALISKPEIYAQVGAGQFQDELRIAQKQKAEETKQDSVWATIARGLYDLPRVAGNDLHPLGTVVNWGNTFMNTAFKAYLIGITAGFLAGAVKAMTLGFINIGSPITLIAGAVGNLFILPGFILAFVVPFIPTFYFMFAVLEWIMSIVEAVIAMPLWALSFITREGDLLGEGVDGVKSLFEIALRPLIIIASLIFALAIFTAGITFINEAFTLYLGAYDTAQDENRGPMTTVMSTLGGALIYTFLVYTYATTCFKLIDVLPDQFTRWLGLPKGFNTMIRAGQHGIKGNLVEGLIFRKIAQKLSGVTTSAIGGSAKAGEAVGKIGKDAAKSK